MALPKVKETFGGIIGSCSYSDWIGFGTSKGYIGTLVFAKSQRA
jgi:hypothetical protein